MVCFLLQLWIENQTNSSHSSAVLNQVAISQRRIIDQRVQTELRNQAKEAKK